jgi:cell division protein ZapA (FtsZ GTPase activity inhibitor)
MKLNYSIRCTKEQKETIQKYSKETGLSVIDSLIQLIERYDKINEVDVLENKIKELNDKIDRALEEIKGIKMFGN